MIEPSAAAANRKGSHSDFLMQETAHLVSACIQNAETPREEVIALIRDTHSALLDLYSRVLGPSEAGKAPSPLKSVDLSDFPEIERTLMDMGARFAIVREIPSAVPAEPAASSDLSIPPPVGAEAPAAEKPAPVPARRAKAKTKAKSPVRARRIQPEPQPPAEVAEPELQLVPAVEAETKAAPPIEPEAEVPAPEAAEAEVLPAAVAEAPAALRKKAAPRRKAAARKLPRGVKSIGDTVRMQSITCLEDGRRVKDLREHLASIGVSVEAYRRKWKLPPEYPMMAPSAILKRGQTFEVDFATGNMIPRI